MPKKSKPTGRPSSYTQEIADAICVRLMEGESLRSICADEAMPGQSTVYQWLTTNEAFAEQYARAREVQADTLADEILEISNTPVVGQKVKITEDGRREISEGDMIEHRRLQVDARKWLAGKLRPKKYSDKLQAELSGPDGGPIKSEATVTLDAGEAYLRMLNGGA